MSDSGLTPGQKASGRKSFFNFQATNVVAFTMLSGSVLTLFSLKLGADSFFVGVLSAMTNLGLPLMLLGRQTIRVIGPKRQWAIFWFLRSLSMLPTIFAPAVAAGGNTMGALLLVLLPFLGFNVFKGMGLVSMNPILGSLAEGKDQGAFLARTQISAHIALIATNIVIAFFLGSDAKLSRYIVLILAGIAAGFLSTVFIFRLPNPVLKTTGLGNTLTAAIRRGLKRPEFVFYLVLASLVAFISGIANPFLVVYAKKTYGLADNMVVLFLVIGNISVIMMGLIVRRLIDTLGGKPLYLVFFGFLCVAVILIVVSPPLDGLSALVFLGVLFFVYNFGLSGGNNSAQSYFYAMTNINEQLNFGILNQLVSGTAAAVGSIAGGMLLGGMESSLSNPTNAFRIFYGIVLVLLLGCFPIILKLKNDGRFSVRAALEIFLSRKNLRTVALLYQLDTSTTAEEEAKAIDSLAESDSPLAVKDLLEKLTSPRFYIRSRALRALENLPLTGEVADALIIQVKRHAFTTGHTAARIMGRKGIRKGLPVLRESLFSEDYRLQAEATLALARLGDRQSIPKIEEVLSRSRIPLVQIYASTALEILGSTSSLPHLFNTLSQGDPPPYFRDEIILSIAGILGIGNWFFDLYSQFLSHARTGSKNLLDYMKDCGVDAETLIEMSDIMQTLQSDRSSYSRKIASRLKNNHENANEFIPVLISVAEDITLMRFDRLAYLMAAILARLECGGGFGSRSGGDGSNK